MSVKRLKSLAKKGTLAGMKGLKLSFKPCTDYLARKQHIALFQYNSPYRRPHVLDFLHFDVCCTMNTNTLRGSRYFVTFFDDHSIKVWVYALKTKDHVFVVFK